MLSNAKAWRIYLIQLSDERDCLDGHILDAEGARSDDAHRLGRAQQRMAGSARTATRWP